MILKLFYSIQNGGDGSAYPKFMESMELAEFDQEHLSGDGWGESCTGTITLESETDIKCDREIVTKEAYFINMYSDHYSNAASSEKKEFLAKFFPNGLPKFTVEMEKPNKDYAYNNVFVGGRKVARDFRPVKNSGKAFEDFLNYSQET